MRTISTLAVAILGLAASAFCQTDDPTGFCPPGSLESACTTGNGLVGSGGKQETIGIGPTSFQMEKNGSTNQDPSISPWFLLVAIPNYTGASPTITNTDGVFSLDGPVINETDPGNAGKYLTTSPDLYTFTGTPEFDGSLNAANLFGADEHAAFGSTPSFFDVFVYEFTPGYDSNIPYTFSVSGIANGLPAGTFLAASGGTNQGFGTPFTTAGLVDGPGCNGANGCTAGPFSTTPEPMSILLLGTVSFLAMVAFRKKSSAA